MSILSVQEISKSYKLRKVVKSLSLEIKSGEVVGLLGPNGAGKTTAFYMIVGLVAADKGTILLDGKDLHGPADASPRQAGARLFATGSVDIPQAHGRTEYSRDPGAARRPRSRRARAGTGKPARRIACRSRAGKSGYQPCPAASGGAWKLHVRSLRILCSYCSTSRLPVSTRYRFSISNALSNTCAHATSAF